jgi:gas vesicle protein
MNDIINYFFESHWAFQLVILSLVIWFLFSSYYLIAATKNFTRKNIYILDSIPAVFTTLGVLGTFIGISIALFAFDVNNIENSIPELLEGMKYAFLTSIIGIVLSIIFSKFLAIVQKKGDSLLKIESKEVQKLGELITVLKDSIDINVNSFQELKKAISSDSDDSLSTHFVKLRNQIKDDNKENKKELSSIVNALGGDNETSILSQIQRLRSEFDDITKVLQSIHQSINGDRDNSIQSTLQDIRKEQRKYSSDTNEHLERISNNISESRNLITNKFDEFTELLEKSNTEALVKAIENVIGGFNDKLAELIDRLVKENFEELNNSVKQLNDWQQENKDMIERLTSQFKEVADNLQISGRSIEQISNSTNKLVSDDGKLALLIKELEAVMVENTNLRESMKMLNTSTLEIQESSKLLNDWMKREKRFADSVGNLITSLKEIEELRSESGKFWDDIKKNLNSSSELIKEQSLSLNSQVRALDDAFRDRLMNSFVNLDKVLQSLAIGITERINKTITK